MKILLLFIGVLYAGHVIACQNSWQDVPDGRLSAKLFDHKLSQKNYRIVEDDKRVIAISRLANRSFVEMSNKDASYYSTGFIRKAGSRYYLVRGLFQNDGGKFSIYLHGDSLYVFNGALGSPGKVRRAALLVELNVKISKVYVGCSVAE